MARARWPGWTREGTLLLPVPPDDWAPPGAPVAVDGIVLQPKRELHVTLVANALARSLRTAAGAGDIPDDAVRDAFEALDWTWERTGRFTLLRAPPKRRGDPPRHSIIEHLRMPAMGQFHGALATLLGRRLPVPPPHVTLLVAGTRRGIALPDPAALEQYAVRPLDARDLSFTPRG